MKKFWIPLVLSLGLSSCNGSKNYINDYFTREEITVLSTLVDCYDDFILTQVYPQKESLSENYKTFLQVNSICVMNSKDMFPVLPDQDRINEVFDILDPVILDLIFDHDSDGNLSINRDGKYLHLLKAMSRHNPLYKKMYDDALSSEGDLYGSFDAVYYYKAINFDKLEDRLVFIANVLTAKSESNSPL